MWTYQAEMNHQIKLMKSELYDSTLVMLASREGLELLMNEGPGVRQQCVLCGREIKYREGLTK